MTDRPQWTVEHQVIGRTTSKRLRKLLGELSAGGRRSPQDVGRTSRTLRSDVRIAVTLRAPCRVAEIVTTNESALVHYLVSRPVLRCVARAAASTVSASSFGQSSGVMHSCWPPTHSRWRTAAACRRAVVDSPARGARSAAAV